jgi:hypothetical protein
MTKRVVEAINGGDNSIDSNGSIEISRSSDGKLIIIEEIFLDISEQMLETNYTLNLRHLLEIAHELKI